jgi:hypothetical protein
VFLSVGMPVHGPCRLASTHHWLEPYSHATMTMEGHPSVASILKGRRFVHPSYERIKYGIDPCMILVAYRTMLPCTPSTSPSCRVDRHRL